MINRYKRINKEENDEKIIEYVEKRDTLRRGVEEIQRQNTVNEYTKLHKYSKNLTKGCEPRNLKVLDVN
jgi:hypothetical protein